MATGLRTVEDRKYTKYTEKIFDSVKDSSKGYLQTLVLDSKDDCAMACDNEPMCKTFQTFKFTPNFGVKYCLLMSKEPKDLTLPTAPATHSEAEVYVKPSTMAPEAQTRLFALKNANPPNYKQWYSSIFSLDDGGLVKFPAGNQPQERCDATKQFCDRSFFNENIFPTGIWTAANNGGFDGMMQMHTGLKACSHIPGVVTNTVPTNRPGNDQPNALCKIGQCTGQDDSFNYCGYNKLNNDWILQNWDNLQNHLASTIGNTYTAYTRPDGSKQNGIFQVDSVKVAKGDFCNTTPLSTFTDTTINGKCKNFIMSQNTNNVDDWYAFLLKRAATTTEDWRTASSVVKDSCNALSPVTQPLCVNAIDNLKTDADFSTTVVQDLNDINKKNGQASSVINQLAQKVDSYCSSRRDNEQCSCRNAVTFGIEKCAPGIKGCEDIVEYQKLAAAIDPNTALSEFIKKLQPRKLASACQKADSLTDGKILQYGLPTNDYIVLNNCIMNLKNNGTLNAENIVQECKIFTATNDKTSSGAGGNDGADGETTTSNTWIWIVLAVVVVLVILSGFGITLFAVL